MYILLFLPFIFSCGNGDKVITANSGEKNDSRAENVEDSAWTYNSYKKGDLSVDITNHNLTNFSIHIQSSDESYHMDLNELNIPWKTPEVTWVNEEMICITNWWSGPFGKCIFILLNGKLTKHIYIDKDLELADSLSNTIVYVDTLIHESRLMLSAENLLTRKKQAIEIELPTAVDLYPFYDSLTLHNSSLNIWIKGERRSIDLKGLNE